MRVIKGLNLLILWFVKGYSISDQFKESTLRNSSERLAISGSTGFKYVIKTLNRLIANEGTNANQEVPHFHVHILGGEKLDGLN